MMWQMKIGYPLLQSIQLIRMNEFLRLIILKQGIINNVNQFYFIEEMNKYQFVETEQNKPLLINYGELGKCQLLVHKQTKVLYVLKLIKNQEEANKSIKCLTSINHNNIITLHEYFKYQQDIVMIFQFLGNGDLYTKIRCGQIKKKDIPRIFRQICEAVHCIHSHKIIHRNLKSENILFDHKMDPKIADFCYSARLTTRKTFCGCTLYMAPQILNSQNYTQKADVWALGVILYEMIYAKMPFEGERPSTMLQEIEVSKPISNIYPRNSAQNLISNMIKKDPSQRLSLCQALKHPFLRPQKQTVSVRKKSNTMYLRRINFDVQDKDQQQSPVLRKLGNYLNNKVSAIFHSK